MSDDDSSTKKFLATQPPAHLPDGGGGGGGDGEGYPSLLNLQVYVADRRNATTASCETEGGGGRRIQLTVCAARPPQVSYICVCCPGEEPDVFGAPPHIVATEADILLLAVVFGPYSARYKPENYEYYVYQALEGPPSLQLIPSPGPSYVQMLSSPVTGILRYNLETNSGRRPGRPSCAYIISAINYTCSIQNFELHVYHSRTKTWEIKLVLRDHDREQQPFRLPHKVITIGGDAGTMAWVDLWNGILFYDLFGKDDAAFGRYVPLPPTPLRPDQLDGCPLGERDIAVINGSIRYIELQTHVGSSKSARERRTYVSYGWTAFMWSRSAADPLLSKESWCRYCKLKASEVSVLGDSKLPNVESLPRLENDEGEPRPTLARLHCGHPTLCLLDHHVFYLMNKIDFRDKKAWVLSVDTRNRTLRDVADFTADRIGGFSFTYRHTRISEYLNMAPGTHHYLDQMPSSRIGTHHYLDQTDVHHGASQADRSIENADVPSISGNRMSSIVCRFRSLFGVKEEEMMSPHASEELTQTAGTLTSSGLLYPDDMNSTHHYLDQTDVHHGASQADRSIENADVPSISGNRIYSTVCRLRSWIWKEFELLEFDQNNGQPARAKCNHCKKELRCSQGTAILHVHLRSKACSYNPLSTADATTNPAPLATGLIYPVKEEEMMSPDASEELTQTAGTWTSSGLLYPDDMNSTQLDQMDVTYGPPQAGSTSISGTQLDQMDVYHGASQVDMWIENAATVPGTEQMNSSVTWMSPGLNNPQHMSIGHAPKQLISEYLNMAPGTLLHSSVGRLRTNVWEEYDQNNLDRAHEVAHLRERYKVDDVVANQASINSIDPRLLALYKNQKDLIGIEGPRQDLTKRLSGGDGGVSMQQLKIVSICGFGGLGKTTLAKAVYDRLKAQFDSSAFVPVGRNPEVKKVFKDILLDLFLVTDTKLALPGLSKEENNLLKLYRNEGRGDLATLDEKQLIDKLRRLLENTRAPLATGLIYPVKEEEMMSPDASEELTQTAGTWMTSGLLYPEDMNSTHHYLHLTDVHHGASQADRSIDNADVPSISGTLLHSSVGRLRTNVWEEFEILEYDQNNRDPARAKCKHSDAVLRCPTLCATGVLHSHLKSKVCPYDPLSTADASEELTQTDVTWMTYQGLGGYSS